MFGGKITIETVWERINKTDTCWLWTGGLNQDGYGKMSLNSKTKVVHRWLYEQLVGPIPGGLQIDHLCRVRNCVNPSHLEPVTPQENIRRGMRGQGYLRGPNKTKKTHCKNGHEFTNENTYLGKKGHRIIRICRACRRVIRNNQKSKKD